MGILRPILDAATDFHGQFVYVNGVKAGEIRLSLPDDGPFGFVCIPQYQTAPGCAVQRGVRLPDSTRTTTG